MHLLIICIIFLILWPLQNFSKKRLKTCNNQNLKYQSISVLCQLQTKIFRQKEVSFTDFFFVISWNWMGWTKPDQNTYYSNYHTMWYLCGFILQVIWAEEAQLTKNCKVNLDVTGIYCHSLGKIDTMGSIILWKRQFQLLEKFAAS